MMTHMTGALSLPLSIVLFAVWMSRRRARKRAADARDGASRKPYTGSQILGIVAILLFLVPTIVTTILTLSKPLIWAVAWALVKLGLPQPIDAIIRTLFATAALTLAFAGTYAACEYIWPKREVEPPHRT